MIRFNYIQWGDIPEYENIYEVNTLGQIRNKKSKRILKQDTLDDGYKRVRLNKNGKQKAYLVHRIVMLVFEGTPPVGREVNHINGIKEDNRIENLEYVTPSENCTHRYKILKRNKRTTTKLTHDNVISIRKMHNSGYTNSYIAKVFNVSKNLVSSVVNYRTWKSI